LETEAIIPREEIYQMILLILVGGMMILFGIGMFSLLPTASNPAIKSMSILISGFCTTCGIFLIFWIIYIILNKKNQKLTVTDEGILLDKFTENPISLKWAEIDKIKWEQNTLNFKLVERGKTVEINWENFSKNDIVKARKLIEEKLCSVINLEFRKTRYTKGLAVITDILYIIFGVMLIGVLAIVMEDWNNIEISGMFILLLIPTVLFIPFFLTYRYFKKHYYNLNPKWRYRE